MLRTPIVRLQPRTQHTLALLALLTAAITGCDSPDDSDATPSISAPVANASIDSTAPITNAAPAIEQAAAPRVPTTGNALEQVNRLEHLLNAEQSGWQTEAINEAAGRQLKRLAHAMESLGSPKPNELNELISDDFHCVPFRPQNTATALTQPGVLTEQSPKRNATDPASRDLRGLTGLQAAIASLPASANTAYHVKFKIVGVQIRATPGDDAFESPVDQEPNVIVESPIYVEGGGVSKTGRVQWRAHWNCEWECDLSALDQTPPRLLSIMVEDYEQVTAPGRDEPWFVDDTLAILDDEPSFANQLSQGMDYWVGRIEGRLGISRLGHHGLAIGDVNNDGREDLYVCQPGGLPNRLYITQPDGAARDFAATAGVDFLDDSTCALLVDLDNDGDRDLVVVTISGAIVLSNDGNARFQPEAIMPQCSNAFSLTAADYDGDRLPDLFVGRYWPDSVTRGEIAIPVPYYDAENGGTNMLLRNTGETGEGNRGWKFSDVTANVGLDENNTRFTMAAAWEDIDNDGDPDLYLANDFGRNCLYRNDEGKFINIAAEAKVEDIASGMSVSFADYDHNGHSDIYVSNMFSSAGNRITYQRQYSERFEKGSLAKLQRMARGNSLFQNQSDGKFADTSLSADVTMGRWAWGSLFADINNDSWDDLIVMNGFISTDDSGDL